jgi:hypothetical protein
MTAQHRPCGKVRYTNERTAIRKAILSSRHAALALRVYRCPGCKGWHLTKKPTWMATPRPGPVEADRGRNAFAHRLACSCGLCAWFDVELSA